MSLRVLVVSMWPSTLTPEFGVFVRGQVSALRALGVDVSVAKLTEQRGGRIRTPIKYWRLRSDAFRIGRETDSQVLHGHFLFPTGWVTRSVARKLGVPYAVTAHGSDVHAAEQSARIHRRVEPIIRDAAAVIAVSHDLATRLRKLYPGLEPVVAHMGYDPDLFHPLSSNASLDAQGRPLVLAVGSLTPPKNHMRLLDAIAGLEHVRLVIIGEGPLRAALEARIAELQLSDRVAIAGRVPLYELPAWLARASAIALPSLREGFGLAALEGAAVGARPVVSQIIPVAGVFTSSGAAELVDPTDTDSLRAGIDRALVRGRLTTGELASIDEGHSALGQARLVLRALESAAN